MVWAVPVWIVMKGESNRPFLEYTFFDSNEYSLMPEYADAFSIPTANKNNIESGFEVQFLEGSAGLNGSFIYSRMSRGLLPGRTSVVREQQLLAHL